MYRRAPVYRGARRGADLQVRAGPPGPALPRGVMLDLSVSNGGYLTTLKSQPCLTAALTLAAAALIPFPARAQGGVNGPGRQKLGTVRSGKVLDLNPTSQTSVAHFSPRNPDNQQGDIVPDEDWMTLVWL